MMIVKESEIRARVDRVRECASRDETIEFFEALSPEARRAATRAVATDSYPPATLAEIERTIAQLFGNGLSWS